MIAVENTEVLLIEKEKEENVTNCQNCQEECQHIKIDI